MSSSTSTSKRWLLLYALTLLVAIGLGWLYAARFEPETQFWVGAFRERREALKNRVDEPYVLFTGDSACSFGVDAEAFTEVTQTPSHNLGGTRQMGVSTFMEETLSQARAGDTIVLMCNPRLLMQGRVEQNKTGAQMALALAEEQPWSALPRGSRPGFNHLISLGAKAALRKPLFRYQATDREADGQVVTALRDHSAGQHKVMQWTESETLTAAETLEYWRARCEEKELQLCYLLPLELTQETVLEENRRAKSELHNFLSTHTKVHLIEMPMDACSANEEDFADTTFHLTAERATSLTKEWASLVP